jgi:hypothetical protein
VKILNAKEKKTNYMKHIAIIVERESGVFYHRLVAPYSYLASKGKIKLAILNGLDSANVGFIAKEKIDAVVFNRVLHPQQKQFETIAKLKKLGVMVVADVDDYWHLTVKDKRVGLESGMPVHVWPCSPTHGVMIASSRDSTSRGLKPWCFCWLS